MDSLGLCNLRRRSMWAVLFCVAAPWGAIAAAGPLSQPESPPDRAVASPPAALQLFLPPALAAADIDPDAPAVYRLPPVNQPLTVDDVALIEDQPADEQLTSDQSLPVLPEASEIPPGDCDETDVAADDSATRAVEAVVATDALTGDEDTSFHHDVDATYASSDHPGDDNAAGGPPMEPAMEAGVLPYTPTAVELTAQLLPAVQHACGLAQRGATFAAQREFIQVLRRIAQANDAQLGTDEHARALAAGLRALDEAGDFVPRGTQLEAELNVAVVASSHRTPVLAGGAVDVRPQEAVALYLSYAQRQLASAVAGQQTGSMALHGLGTLYSRTAQRGDGDLQQLRKAMTMYSAALEACPQNYLAANELGVLLARNGHYAEAQTMFQRAVEIAPTATGYHNLAVVQQKLNQPQEAIANQQQADRLAAWERATGDVSRRKGVQWVPPNVLAGSGQQLTAPTAGVIHAETTPAPASLLPSPPFGPPSLPEADPLVAAPVAQPDSIQRQNRTW